MTVGLVPGAALSGRPSPYHPQLLLDDMAPHPGSESVCGVSGSVPVRCRLLCVLCCDLDSFLLLESQYALCSMLLLRQKENVTEPAGAQG